MRLTCSFSNKRPSQDLFCIDVCLRGNKCGKYTLMFVSMKPTLVYKVLKEKSKAYSEFTQTSKMELCAKVINSSLDICLDSKYASENSYIFSHFRPVLTFI